MKKRNRGAGLKIAVSAAVAGIASAAGAHAQEAASEEIVVTGTRLKQANLESATPTVTIAADRLEAGSSVEIGGILRDLPASGIAAATPQTTAGLVTTGFGLSTFNLRNLTENRTLILVDGRRFVSGLPGQNIVDLNAIPPEAIERIDVVTGGASAVYGSDALAGVVNIILRDDFDGVTFSGQGGITEQGDAETFRFAAIGGSEFAEGMGHATVSLGYSRENGAFARDRDFLAIDSVALAALGGPSDDIKTVVEGFFSSYSEMGRIGVPNGPLLVVDDDGAVRPFNLATDGFNRNEHRALSSPIERYSATFDLDYSLSEAVNWFGQFTFSSATA